MAGRFFGSERGGFWVDFGDGRGYNRK